MKIENISKLFYKIKLIEKKLNKNFECKIGISLTRYEILITILNNENISQVDLQEYLKIDQAAITRHLKKLEENNYVLRKRNPNNNRELVLSVTEKTKEMLDNCKNLCPNLNKFFGDEFSEKEAMQLFLLLDKFEKNII